MSKLVVCVVALLVGCGADAGDPHQIVDCAADSGWTINGNPYEGACELACAAGATTPVDEDENNLDDRCDPICPISIVAEIDGVVGCCMPGGTDGPIVFRECE